MLNLQKKWFLAIILVSIAFLTCNTFYRTDPPRSLDKERTLKYLMRNYVSPKFYQGIYMNYSASANMKKFKSFVDRAKNYGINVIVLDVDNNNIYRWQQVQYLLKKGIHPVARIVVFSEGLKKFPPSIDLIYNRLWLVKVACDMGFREVQLDYIRFSDSNKKIAGITNIQRHKFINTFVYKAKKITQRYGVKIAVDIFGRIPFGRDDDRIGQGMDSLSAMVDVICPMAYPSHYEKKLRHRPFSVVKWTVDRAVKRTKGAKVVAYLQGFKWRMPSMSMSWYIANQIYAVKAAKGGGFIMWNVNSDYNTLYSVLKYIKAKKSVIKKIHKK